MPRTVLAVEGMMINKTNLVLVFMEFVVRRRQTPVMQVLNYKERDVTKGMRSCHEIQDTRD